MEDVADVEIGQAVVERHSETRHVGCAETSHAPTVEKITGIGHGLRVSVGGQEIQAIRELLSQNAEREP